MLQMVKSTDNSLVVRVDGDPLFDISLTLQPAFFVYLERYQVVREE